MNIDVFTPWREGDIGEEEGKKILKDGKVRGKKLTVAQKRLFGFIVGGGTPTHTKPKRAKKKTRRRNSR